jgi:opacity protein-like surface antigen
MSRFISLFIIGIVLTTSLAFANPNYYANIGMSKPYAPENFQKNWRSGFNLGTGIGYNVKPTLELQGEFLYDNFQLDDNAFLGDVTTDDDIFASVMGGSVSILSLYVNAKFLSPLKTNDTITPYLIGGVGLVSKMTGEKEIMTELLEYIEPKESTTTAAAGLGIGVEIVMGARTSFVVEGRFNVLFTDETTVYFPLKLGIVIR